MTRDQGWRGEKASGSTLSGGVWDASGQPSAPNGILKAFYKGKSRPVHDGLGLCSMGRQMRRCRKWKGSRLAMALKKVFWEELDVWLDRKGKVEADLQPPLR